MDLSWPEGGTDEERSALLSLTSDWTEQRPKLVSKKRPPLLQQTSRF